MAGASSLVAWLDVVWRWALRLALGIIAVSVLWVALYRVVAPPVTPLMLLRAAGGATIAREWVPIEEISPHLVRAVVAAEDTGFCGHNGFDWGAIDAAAERMEQGKSLRGASTISMQTAKNAFLWPTRSWPRKAFEAYFTVLLELMWPKRRVLEVYLNIVEWGDGIYGAAAAARAHFGKRPAALSRREAALMAVVLPDPRDLSPARPSRYVSRRAETILARMGVVENERLAACAERGRR